MIIEFAEEYLQDLYETGKTKSKKHRFQKPVINKYIAKVNILASVKKVEDLFVFNSLNYEVLTNANGRQSVRVDKKYRIEFFTRIEGEEDHIITICNIVDLSNHYS